MEEENEQKSPQMNPVLKSFENPQSKTMALRAKCAECFGCTEDHVEPGFRQMIRDCTSTKCPLHRFRPYQAKEKEE